jgi:serine/threonine-protein kinase
MGEVSLAQDNDIGRAVAVKQLVASTQNPTGVARFIDEIRTIGQLEHPNIVPIHDVGVDPQGQIFLVMKYVDGETLESIIKKLQAGDPAYLARYSMDYRMEIFLGVLHALQCAHEKGVIHRDIKPANVMVGRFGEVVLMDWGVAKMLPKDGAAVAGEFVGTPAYMSPEQAAGSSKALDPRSDIYSAAAMFHELLCLRHYLGHCQSLQALLVAIASEPFTAPRLLALHHPQHPAPPAELMHFVAKAMAKDPAQRFQSVDQMIDELQAMRDGRIRVQCPVTLARRMTSEVTLFLGRSPVAAITAFYAVLLLLICCVGVTLHTLVTHLL